MKNSKLIFFFVGILLILPVCLIAQDEVVQTPGLFAKLTDWIKGGAMQIIAGAVSALLARYGVTLIIKKIAQNLIAPTQEIGEFFLGGSDFFKKLDKSIKADGSFNGDSLQELIESGKTVIAEAKDVIISIKPKT